MTRAKRKPGDGGVISQIIIMLILAIIAFACVYPMYYCLVASFSDPMQMLSASGFLWWPQGFSTIGYELALKNTGLVQGFANTLFVVIVGTALNLILTACGAYVLSRKHLAIKTPLVIFITITMFFGGGMIPSFILVRDLGLFDTLWALILPGAISTFNMIIMRTGFQSLPDSLEEAAIVDGAGDFQVLFRIIIPLSKPVFMVIGMYYAIGHWNSWFNASIYLQTRANFPAQLILRQILIDNSTDMIGGDALAAEKAFINETLKYAATIITTVPILCVYPFIQKHFVKGVMIGAIKA